MPDLYAGVAVNLTAKRLDRLFSYIVPDELKDFVKPGSIVEVPFRNKTITGFVLELTCEKPSLDPTVELKKISSVLKESSKWHTEMTELAGWMQKYYGCTFAEALRAVFPERYYKSSISRKKIKRFAQLKITMPSISPPTLTEEQRNASGLITDSALNSRADIFLLYGVTGSGKTEVYLDVIEKVTALGKTAIVLIPEISLTTQYVHRFKLRLGDDVAILHSSMTDAQRNSEWQKIFSGETKVVIGARSAVFAPVENLALIIVDEEHEGAYKQESQPKYNARQVAIKRSVFNKCPVVLGSATPSLESYAKAKCGKYILLELKKRPTGTFPDIRIVDMKKKFNSEHPSMLSPFLIREIKKRLDRNEQSLLFISRRGFFNYLYCSDCGHIFFCKSCDVALRVHKKPPSLLCHYCDQRKVIPDICPSCSGCNISSKGGGTQRLEEELKQIFPEARVLRMDRDSASTLSKSADIYQKFFSGEGDILIGTQMIAKGFDFPKVTLSGVVLADVLFSMPDFRASEHAFQLFSQVLGRAGRRGDKSLFVLQSFNPEHIVISSIENDNHALFYYNELKARREFSYPPYLHMIRVLIYSENEKEAKEAASSFARLYITSEREVLYGPSLCPIARISGKFRRQLFIKTGNVFRSVEKYRKIVSDLSCKTVIFSIDVDSLSFL